ncbi:MAG: hypothetical protein GC160_17265 [Acidobacteria bacterium]|nr:hypothetical protein [Acidobacteriota bacterium]
MFDLFRSQRKVVKWTLGAVLSLVALSMVVTLIPNVFSSQPTDLNDPVLVQVGDEAVKASEVYQGLREYAQAGTPPESMAFMARQIVDNLIEEKVLMQEASDLGVRPTDAELAQWIKEQMPFLWQGGQFNSAQYQQLIMQRFQMSVPQFESDLLKDLTIELRLRRLVTGNIVMTEQDIKDAFEARNQKAQVDYLLIKAADFRNDVKVTDEALAAFFEQQKFRYRIPEKRTVKVIDVTPAKDVDVSVSEAEVRAFYEQNRYRFETPERVMARHILFMTIDPEAANPETAELPAEKVKEIEAKAREVLAKVKAGEDFAKLAEEYSDDPGTKNNGGDLGWVYRGQMTPKFEEAVFSMEPGAVSQDLVKTEFGYHIIKVEKKDRPQLKSLDEVHDEIVADLKAERVEVAKMDRLDKIVSEIRNDVTKADQIAQEYELPIMTYANIDQQAPPPDLTRTPTFIGNIMSAPAGTAVTNTAEGSIQIAAIMEVVPSRDATIEEVKDRLQQDYIQAQSRTLAEARAKEVAEAAKSGDLQSAAKQFGLKVQTSSMFTRRDNIEGLSSAQTLGDTPFNAAVGTVFGPVSAGEAFAVAKVAAQEPADMALYPEQKTEIRETYLQGKQDEAFNIFRTEARQRFEKEGKIKRYDDRINQLVQQIRRT